MNDADEETLYSYMVANSTDVSDGTEDGKLGFYVMNNGAIPKLLELEGTKISGHNFNWFVWFCGIYDTGKYF